MDHRQINQFLGQLSKTKDRNIVIIDFANVDRWEDSLGWTIGVEKLGKLVSHMTYGKKYLRRFYYGEDYGPKGNSKELTNWSNKILTSAQYNRFEIVSKRVKYIPDIKYATGYISKCNFDIEMAVDLMREQENYDAAIVFSGDGDLAYVFEYLHEAFKKTIYIFGARNHVGKELVDAKKRGVITDILFVEDFDYRLDLRRP